MKSETVQKLFDWLHDNLTQYDVDSDESIYGISGEIHIRIWAEEIPTPEDADSFTVFLLANAAGRYPIEIDNTFSSTNEEFIKSASNHWNYRIAPVGQDFKQAELVVAGVFTRDLEARAFREVIALAAQNCIEVNMQLQKIQALKHLQEQNDRNRSTDTDYSGF